MAKRLRENQVPKLARTGPKLTYPYDEWLDGSRWHLVVGEDFNIGIQSMISLLKKQIVRRKLKVKYSIYETVDPSGIYIFPRKDLPKEKANGKTK